MSGAPDVPVEWLQGTPFRSYFLPSVVLFTVVGGSLLLAAVAMMANWTRARAVTFGALAILFTWLAVQVALIGYVSWMQPTTAAAGAFILVLAWCRA